MTLIRVYTDTGDIKPVHLLAKIFDVKDSTFFIRYLSPTEDTKHGKKVYRYEEEVYEVTDDSISEYLNTDIEEDIGFSQLPCGGFIYTDSDSDYAPDDDLASSSDISESVVSEDQDEEDYEWEDDEYEE
jgi:hypothetical protein